MRELYSKRRVDISRYCLALESIPIVFDTLELMALICAVHDKFYRKENAAYMYMQDVLQPKSVFFTVRMFLHQLPRTTVSQISSYKKCTIKYKLGGYMCISVEHVSWVNF